MNSVKIAMGLLADVAAFHLLRCQCLAGRRRPAVLAASELPPHADSDQLMQVAEQEGVGIFSGRGYFASDPPRNFIRLCYATCTESKMDERVRKLGDVVQRLHNAPGEGVSGTVSHQHFD